MVRSVPQFILVLILAVFASASLFNETGIKEVDNEVPEVGALRQGPVMRTGIGNGKPGKKEESTSSSGSRQDTGSKAASSSSLDESVTRTSSEESKPGKKSKDRAPKSSEDRKGWRKWHRKCTKCPEDMVKKWRDPSIKWICGAYQRARRTFKSLCMMHYRNCQDGTMFTKIGDHRCPDSQGDIRPYNQHFFYDYSVSLSEDKTSSDETATSTETSSSSSSWDTSRIEKIPNFKD